MAILNRFYQFAADARHNSRFLMCLSNIKMFRNIWIWIKWHLLYKRYDKPEYQWPTGIPANNEFWGQNAARVTAMLNKLADKKSKQTYATIIECRNTFYKRKFVFNIYDTQQLQYFIKEVSFGTDEVFVDCGAYDGDTIDNFIKLCPNYKQIVAFEPEPANFEQLKSKYGSTPKITLLKAGAWHKEETVAFAAGLSSFSAIIDGGETHISTKSIDSLELDKVTFIKMDIEGAEMNALKGATKTILRDKPKLAICIYHSNEDMLDIPEYIHSLVPEYKLYVRQHHANSWLETVLYAMM